MTACGGNSDGAGAVSASSPAATGTTQPAVTATTPTNAILGTDDALATPVAATPAATPATPATPDAVATPATPDAAQAGTVPARVMEKLGRGVVALRKGKTVTVTWRLLGLDPAAIAFNVYRSANGATATKLNAAALTAGTNYSDTTVDLTATNIYTVRPVLGGVEQADSGPFTLTANHADEPLIRIPLAALPGTDYTTKFVWVGDLDGDGEYDFVIDRLAPLDATNNDIGLGNQYLEAYKRNGTRLWQIDMGPSSRKTYNISPGAATLSMGMYDGVTVYDLNGDGKAEVVLKVADGVKFGDGTTFTNADTTKQFIAVLDGMTGKPLATRAFPTDFAARGPMGTQLGIGYPDGISPSIYFWGRNRNADKSFNDVFASWSWDGAATISQNWSLPLTDSSGKQASHQMRIIDVDGDGKDEMATGNFVVNSDGTLRYVLPGVIHGDRFYIGKMEPNSVGLQGYGIQQNNPSGLLEYYYDATAGTIKWSHSTTPGTLVDVGRGQVGDIDDRYAGFETWSFSGVYNGASNALTQADTTKFPWPNQQLWWDGDLLSEELSNGVTLDKWNPLTGTTNRVVSLYKYGVSFGAGGDNPNFMGDILGDWRTEIVGLNAAKTELIIFSSPEPTTTRLYTMAHNPAYRNHMTIKGYLQSPVLDYYMGSGMSTPPVPNIRYAGSGVIQAESAVLAGGTTVATNRSGYHGNGFIDFPATGGTARFNNIDGGAGGTKTIAIRYANGDGAARGGVLTVNGVAQNISFASTGGWTQWASLNVALTLKSGVTNQITFASNGNDLGNIDEITVQ